MATSYNVLFELCSIFLRDIARQLVQKSRLYKHRIATPVRFPKRRIGYRFRVTHDYLSIDGVYPCITWRT